MAHLGAFKNMFEEIEGANSGDHVQVEEEALGRGDSGFVGLDNQGATCYLNALLQAIYMTPELRHGLYAVDPKELGGDRYDQEREKDREKEKARLTKERAMLKKQEKEGRMQPDPVIVKRLEDIFSLQGARRAALETNNKGFEAALEWALQHSQDTDFEGPLPGDDDDVEGNESTAEPIAAASEEGGGFNTNSSIHINSTAGKKKKGLKAKSAKMIPLELQRLFARLQLLDTRTVSTEDLTERGFKWKNDEGRMQHDAHELIRLLIDRLERDMQLSKVNAGLVSALYEGNLANQVKCLACGHVSERREKYRDLLLQVAGQEDLVTSLLSYTRPERLSGDNQYFCDRCESKQDALRSQTLTALPPLLIFSLNRFEFDFETLERVKVQSPFKYPLTLDMEPFVDGSAWSGNDNSDEGQVPELAGNPDIPGTCRNRQKWVPQAWKEAEQNAGDMFQASPILTQGEREAAMFGDGLRKGVLLEKGKEFLDNEEEEGGERGGAGGLIYDLLAVVVHRGSGYSGHYHAFIKDCLQEGRWLSPSGFSPSLEQRQQKQQHQQQQEKQQQQKEQQESDTGTSAGNQEGGAGKGQHANSNKKGKRGGSAGSLKGFHKGGFKEQHQQQQQQTQQQTQPKLIELAKEILRAAPKHKELQVPCMTLPALRAEIKERMDGNKYIKVFGKKQGKLRAFLSSNTDAFVLQETQDGPTNVLLIASDESGDAAAEGGDTNGVPGDFEAEKNNEDAELQKVLQLSLREQSKKQSKKESKEQPKERLSSLVRGRQEGLLAPASGTALGGGEGADGGMKAVPKGVVDALASEKYGRWFSFDDRKVSPISILDLQKPFSGPETAYLLIYRSRTLDQEPSSSLAPSTLPSLAADMKKSGVLRRGGAGGGAGGVGGVSIGCASGGGGVGRPSSLASLTSSLHMTSVPPEYWMDKVEVENTSLKTANDSREADLHAVEVKVWLPRMLSPQLPHLVPLLASAPELEELPEELREPFVVHLDDRQTVADLKREAVKRVGVFYREMGIPQRLERVRLSGLATHGPGLFLSKHLPDTSSSNSSDNSSDNYSGDSSGYNKCYSKRRGGHGGRHDRKKNAETPRSGINSNSRSGKGGRGDCGSGGGDGDGKPSPAVLGDLEWISGPGEECNVLVWDGLKVEGVKLPDPSPATRPIRLVVSVLKATNIADPFAWVDELLLSTQVLAQTRSGRQGARAETVVKWNDVYAPADVTASEIIQLVTERGGGGISSSKICISLLKAASPNSLESSKRRSSQERVEAVQIAGPAGVFEEWKLSKSSGTSSSQPPYGDQGLEDSVAINKLGICEGSEVVVEEQGAVSSLMAIECTSLAQIEAARRNLVVRVSVEVEESLLEKLTMLGLALAHDAAVNLHNNQEVVLEIETDARRTTIPHLKARCLLSLAPGLASLRSSALRASSLSSLKSSPESAFAPSLTTSSVSSLSSSARAATSLAPTTPAGNMSLPSAACTDGKGKELALVGLVAAVRLEYSISGCTLDDSVLGMGSSLEAAKIGSDTSLVLEWGSPLEIGQALVKFHVRVGNGTSSSRDPSRLGTTLGPLEVLADFKEPVSALKARMVDKAFEAGFISDIAQKRRIRVSPLVGDSSVLVQELKEAEPTSKATLLSASQQKQQPATTSTTAAATSSKGLKLEKTPSVSKTSGGKGKGGTVREGAKGNNDDAVREERGMEGTAASAGSVHSSATNSGNIYGASSAGKNKSKKRKKKKKGAEEVKEGGPIEKNIPITKPQRKLNRQHPGGQALSIPLGGGAKGELEPKALVLFQELLVEESGILGGEEVSLEDGRVPKPRELEVAVLVYAPHFLGLAAAAATETLPTPPSRLQSKLEPQPQQSTTCATNTGSSNSAASAVFSGGGGGGCVGGTMGADKNWGDGSRGGGKPGGSAGIIDITASVSSDRSSNRSRKRSPECSFSKGEAKRRGSVPTGLSLRSVWPDEEEAKKKADIEEARGDPLKAGCFQRLLSLRTLGTVYIDERKSLTDLRVVLRRLLLEGLGKASVRCRMEETARMARAAEAKDQAAAACAATDYDAASAAARASPANEEEGGDSDVMRDDELENIRKSMKNKKNTKPKKKRSSAGGGGSTKSKNNKPPVPPSKKDTGKGLSIVSDSGVSTEPDTGAACDSVVHYGTEPSGTSIPAAKRGLEEKNEAAFFKCGVERKSVKEVGTGVADSDDEIPLPEEVPGFERLEEAMLVRELRRDRLPGKIVRKTTEIDAAGGLLVCQPISELHLGHTTALVLCLRPRLPQPPLDLEALQEEVERERREKIAKDLVEDGQASVEGGGEGEGSLEEKVKELDGARMRLQALEATMSELIEKKEHGESALEEETWSNSEMAKNFRCEDQQKYIQSWEKQAKARRDQEGPLELEVKAMRSAVDQIKKMVEKMEKDRDESTQQTAEPSLFTLVKGVVFTSAKGAFGLGKTTADFPEHSMPANSKEVKEDEGGVSKVTNVDSGVTQGGGGSGGSGGSSGGGGSARKDDDWGVGKLVGNASKNSKSGGGKSGGKKSNSSISSSSPNPGVSSTGKAGAGAGGNNASALVEARARKDAIERRRVDPLTDLHLWTFFRRNPLGNGGVLPEDCPEWPGPLKEVIVENASQPSLELLHEALGKAYGLPATRVRAIKFNSAKHHWVHLTPELGVKKVKKKKKSKGAGGDGRRQVTNLRESPYSVKDGDIVAIVDKMEDPQGQADLTRAEDEAYREQGNEQPKDKKDKRKKRPAPKRQSPEIGLTLGDWDDGEDEEDEGEDGEDDEEDCDDLADIIF